MDANGKKLYSLKQRITAHADQILVSTKERRAKNKILYSILKYFVAKKNLPCYTIYNIWIILLCESTVYTVRHFVFA